MKKINEVIAATLCWLASYSLIEALRAAADKKVLRAQARREAELKLEVAAAFQTGPDAPKADKKKKDKINCCAVPAQVEVTVTHFAAEPDRPSPQFTLAVAMLVLMCALAWYGGREIVNALAAWQKRAGPVKTAPVKTAPVVKVLPAAPRPPVPQKGNLSESIGWWQARAIAADEAAMVICVSGRSLLADRRLADGKWIAFAGDSRLTYNYESSQWAPAE